VVFSFKGFLMFHHSLLLHGHHLFQVSRDSGPPWPAFIMVAILSG
jgi:hypothetical protein